MIQILLQTTIVSTSNDWHIGRFSLLAAYLRSLRDESGRAVFQVTARDRGPTDQPDPVISTLDTSSFDEMWLFAVDTGNGLTDLDREAIDRFQRRGGGLLVTRDHMDLGCSVCSLGGIGAAHIFHTHNIDPEARPWPDDTGTPDILWPNFHSGANGDAQEIRAEAPVHVVLQNAGSPTGAIRYLPAHPHEGAVVAPAGDARARVIATGVSRETGTRFNLVIAFEKTPQLGRALAESTFHHFADYNWDPSMGAPDFVTERPGTALAEISGARDDVRRYVRSVALWLAGRN